MAQLGCCQGGQANCSNRSYRAIKELRWQELKKLVATTELIKVKQVTKFENSKYTLVATHPYYFLYSL